MDSEALGVTYTQHTQPPQSLQRDEASPKPAHLIRVDVLQLLEELLVRVNEVRIPHDRLPERLLVVKPVRQNRLQLP